MTSKKRKSLYKMTVKKINIANFPYYYCPVENRYVNLYNEKCPHLKAVYNDFVDLYFTEEEILKRLVEI